MLVSTLTKLLLLSAGATALKFSPPAFPRYEYSSQMSHIHSRQDGSQNQTLGYYPVTGVLDRELNDGPLPVRREIREMEKDQDLWTLYLLGLDFMQATQQEDPTSWYKIMGKLVHFRQQSKHQEKVTNTRKVFTACHMKAGTEYHQFRAMSREAIVRTCRLSSSPGTGHGWLCTRYVSSIWEITEHLLNFYQQILYDHIQFIATLYEIEDERVRYTAAARKFRIPYWDWAITPEAREGVYPRSVQSPSVDINGPFGIQTIANPLYSYSFHPFDAVKLSMPQVSIEIPNTDVTG